MMTSRFIELKNTASKTENIEEYEMFIKFKNLQIVYNTKDIKTVQNGSIFLNKPFHFIDLLTLNHELCNNLSALNNDNRKVELFENEKNLYKKEMIEPERSLRIVLDNQII